MSKDYSATVKQAVDAIDKYGRLVTLRQPTTDTEAGKPWRGPNDTDAPAAAGSDFPVKAVFIGPSKALSEDFLAGLDDVAIVAGPADYSACRLMIDGGKVFKIVRQQTIKPGDTIVLTYLGVSR